MRSSSRNPCHVDLLEPGQPICSPILSYSSLRSQLGMSVEVTATSATMADGDIVGELHSHLDEQQMLPDQHLMDMGYVDAEVLAESHSRYQVDIVGPVMPDTSWASKEAGRFDHSQFLID